MNAIAATAQRPAMLAGKRPSCLAPLPSTLLLVLAGRTQPHWVQALAVALRMLEAWLSVRGAQAADPA